MELCIFRCVASAAHFFVLEGKKMKERTLEQFLVKAYFGLTPDDLKNNRKTVIEKCIKRAYLDMCRTLRFQSKDNDFSDHFGKKLLKVFSSEESVEQKKEKAFSVFFDDKDKVKDKVKDEVLKYIKDGYSFKYGQAQKWINMTLKYMWLLGYIDDENELDVPIDGIVLSEIKDRPINKAWSTFVEDDYDDAQKTANNLYASKGFNSKIEWENDLWINH